MFLTVTTDITIYYEMDDGTWQRNDVSYQYRLEVSENYKLKVNYNFAILNQKV